jgi:methylthioribose-1-phosphate isomerase
VEPRKEEEEEEEEEQQQQQQQQVSNLNTARNRPTSTNLFYDVGKY